MDEIETDAEIRLLNKVFRVFDFITVRFSILIVVLLFLIGVTLVLNGVSLFATAFKMLIGKNGDILTSAIGALGSTAIGYAILDLARSILREEIEEERVMEVQERSRDFITRILSVVVIALAVGTFVNEATYSNTKPEILWQISTVGIAIAAILIGWGTYLKFSRK